MFHNGMTNNDLDYEMCFRIDNVVLPKNGYFGISAATGMLYEKNIGTSCKNIYVIENMYSYLILYPFHTFLPRWPGR